MELLSHFTMAQAPVLPTILREGWAAPEPLFVWSVGRRARLDIPLQEGDGLVFLELALVPFVQSAALPWQRLDVIVNGMALPSRRLSWPCVLRLDIPQAATRGQDRLVVALGLPDATSPQALGLSDDARSLGVQLSAIKLLRGRAADAPPAAAGPARLTEFRFGANEVTAPMLLDGWDVPESDFVWAIGRRSTLRVPVPTDGSEVSVLVDIVPHAAAPPARSRIVVGADDRLLGFVSVAGRTCLGFVLPAILAGAPSVVLSFDHLDVTGGLQSAGGDVRALAFMLCSLRVIARPALPACAVVRRAGLAGRLDDGSLAGAIEAVAGASPETIARGFMGLGWACELAVLQRRLGWDYAGLFRFAGIWSWGLIEAVLHGFRGLGRPDTLSLNVRADHDRGYWMVDSVYGMSVQTSISSLTVGEAALKHQLGRALPLLARKFFEDLAAGERICVFQRRDQVSAPEVQAVLAALSVWGDVTLLWVVRDNARAGEAERLGPRLLRGFVDDSAPFDQGSEESWLSVLANAWMLAGRADPGSRPVAGPSARSSQEAPS